MLEKIKAILGIADSDKDNLLDVYIELVQAEINSYTGVLYDATLEHLAIQMVVEKYNHRFAEGLASQGVSGISTTYLTGYSDYVVGQLNIIKQRNGAKVVFL